MYFNLQISRSPAGLSVLFSSGFLKTKRVIVSSATISQTPIFHTFYAPCSFLFPALTTNCFFLGGILFPPCNELVLDIAPRSLFVLPGWVV
jgi:hypothetical protein